MEPGSVQVRSEPKTTIQIEEWLIHQVSRHCGSQPAPNGCFADLLDSMESMLLLGDLERWLGYTVSPTLFREFPTINLLARRLGGERMASPSLQRAVPDHGATAHAFAEYVNPHLAALLRQLKLDKEFSRGVGCELWDTQGRRYLDFVASYGALPFGHNPPEIWAALREAQENRVPSFIQPSMLCGAGQLAERLVALLGPDLRYVTFANSGAEAVEVAIKLCRASTRRMGILSTEGSFHGKTLGALSATGNVKYQEGFGAPASFFHSIPFGDIDSLRTILLERPDYYAAFIIEPIQGEGGIVEPPPGYLAAAKALCHSFGVLFVVDEVQTGLGRTGALFATHAEGIQPDVITLAKALGGGLFPIGACVASDAVYTEHFALKHSSTFAGGALACAAGLRTLELLERDGFTLVRTVAENGARLKQALLDLQRRYPRIIAEVRGRGYFLGLRLGVDRWTWRSSVLGVAAEQGGLAPIVASYLLNVEGIRVAPTLNGADVIRIEPPLTATWQQCESLLSALERALPVFDSGDAGCVLGSILSEAQQTPSEPLIRGIRLRPPDLLREGDGRFAFVLHPLDLHSYADFDATLSGANSEEAIKIIHGLGKPAVVGETRVVGSSGRSAFGEFILIGRTATEFMAMEYREAVEQVREAVKLARARGAQIVGLGAFTSVVTEGGLAVADCDVAVTTGNTYTAVAAVEAVHLAMRALSANVTAPTIAVVGAAGAIGRTTATLLAATASRLILVGNPMRDKAYNRTQLLRVATEVCRYIASNACQPVAARSTSVAGKILSMEQLLLPNVAEDEWLGAVLQLEREGFLLLTHGADSVLPLAHVVILATNSTKAIVKHYNLRRNAIVCDVSRPRNVEEQVQKLRPDLLIIDGGLIEVPGKPHLGFFGLPQGLAYACMAESMMLALEQRYAHTSLGSSIDIEGAALMRHLADTHGFRIAALRSFDRPLPQEHHPRGAISPGEIAVAGHCRDTQLKPTHVEMDGHG